jgi:nucleoside-diphosphate-sugar epimerase
LNTSLQIWWDIITSTKPLPKETLLGSNAWVDVRDIALSHVLALEKDAAGGERTIVSEGLSRNTHAHSE